MSNKKEIKKYLMGFDLTEVYRINATKNIKLSLKHLTFLRWFVDFLGTNRMETKVVGETIWYWCAYQKVMDDLPILEITNKQVISRLVKDLVEGKILESFIDKKCGNKTFIRLSEGYIKLISTEEREPLNFEIGNYQHKRKKPVKSKVKRVSTKKSIGCLLKSGKGIN